MKTNAIDQLSEWDSSNTSSLSRTSSSDTISSLGGGGGQARRRQSPRKRSWPSVGKSLVTRSQKPSANSRGSSSEKVGANNSLWIIGSQDDIDYSTNLKVSASEFSK